MRFDVVLALLVSTDRAMREPLLRGTSSRLAPRFRFCISHIEYFKSCLGGDRGQSYRQKTKFMKKIFFFLLGLLSSCSLWAETVHVETPGTLKELLMDLEFTGTQLTLTGTLNAADLSFIHDGKGRMENVEELDISQIKVMPSDESYASGKAYRIGGDNLPPTVYFYYSDEYSCDTSYVSSGLGYGYNIYRIHDNKLAGLFIDNTAYKKVVLPNWLDAIGGYMFERSNVKTVIFPDSYKEIEEEAFAECKITEIKLPTSCKTIKKKAFCESDLKTINLENVTSLGQFAFASTKLEGGITIGPVEIIPAGCFEECPLTSVKFSKGLKIIGENAFARNSSTDKDVLISLAFPEGLEGIYDGAFNGRDNLTTVEFPKTLKYVGYYAFSKNFIKTLLPDDGVYYIGNVAYAFAESAKSMPSIKFKDGTTALSSNLYAFQSYIQSTLTTIEIPSSVKQIGYYYSDYDSDDGIFEGCTALQTVILHEGLESIGYGIFKNCTSLKNINLPNSLLYIGQYAFYKTGITSLTLGENLRAINYYAFDGCNSLITVRLNSKELRKCYANLKKCPIEKITIGPKVEFVPNLLAGNTSVIKVVFEEDKTNPVPLEIGDGAFEYCTSLKIPSLPSRLTKIGNQAFYKCIFTSERFSNQNITSIGNEAFAKITGNLKYVELHSNLKECGYGVFSELESLKEVYYDVPSIDGGGLFSKCNTEKITIGPHVRKLPNNTFRYNSIETLIFEGLKATSERPELEIGNYCFEYSYIENDVILPDVPTKIGERAFYLTGASNIHLGEGTYYIGEEAFSGSNQYIDLPPTVDYIGYQALGNCHAIVHSPTMPSHWEYSRLLSYSKLYVPKGTKQSYVSKYLGYKSDNIIEYGIDMNASEITIKPDEATQLTGLFLPDGVSLEDVPNITFVWESSDPSVATVDENGKVTAVGEGTATITAYASYHGGYSKSCLITVSTSTDINHVNVEEGIQVRANQGRLLISGARDNDTVNVYTMDGWNVVKTTDKVISHLTRGIYIVSIRNQRFKIKL